jgi:hypothetical protein
MGDSCICHDDVRRAVLPVDLLGNRVYCRRVGDVDQAEVGLPTF